MTGASGAGLPGPAAGLVIDLARPDEFDEVDRLIEAAYRHDYGPDEDGDSSRFARTRTERFDVWVARGGEAAPGGGPLLGSVTTRRAGGPALHEGVPTNELDLRLLGVDPAVRRRGVGALLMRHVLAHAEREGFDAVTLKTQPFMRSAHRLYERLGFTRAPERDGLWIDGRNVLDLIAYRRPVGPDPSS